jgi:hypothetical protein
MEDAFVRQGRPGGGWITWRAWAAFYFVGHAYKALPPAGLLLPLLGVPTILLGLKEPMEYMEKRKRGKRDP